MVLLRCTPNYGYLYPKEAGYASCHWDNSGVLRSNILTAGNEIIRFIYATFYVRSVQIRAKRVCNYCRYALNLSRDNDCLSRVLAIVEQGSFLRSNYGIENESSSTMILILVHAVISNEGLKIKSDNVIGCCRFLCLFILL